MKRTKFLALALAVAVMLMGAGYAAWNEQVTITNNLTTGNLSVALADGSVEVYESDTASSEDDLDRTADAIADTSGDSNTATVTVTNLYPGAYVEVSIPVTNDGSIPVIIDPTNGFAHDNTDTWLSITELNTPSAIDVDGTEYIDFAIEVGDAPESTTVSFDVTANYIQFNQ